MDEDREEKEAPKDTMMIDSTLEENIPEDHGEIAEKYIMVDPTK